MNVGIEQGIIQTGKNVIRVYLFVINSLKHKLGFVQYYLKPSELQAELLFKKKKNLYAESNRITNTHPMSLVCFSENEVFNTVSA